MRTRPVLFRLSAALAIVGTSIAAADPGFAQSAPAAADPPARVGRLARLSGTVSFHTADQQEWQAATLNYPVTSGNSFWTEPGAAAQIEIGATHLALDQQTELDIDTLDNTQLAATEPQGGVYLDVRLVNPGETTSLRTPRGTVQIASVGRYEVVAGDTEQPTRVTVVEGAAQVTGPDGLSLSVGPHQTATVNGSDHLDGSVGPEVDDPFLTAQLQAEQPAPAPAPVSTNQRPAPPPYQPPPLVQQMTGAEDLTTVGSWTEAPQYGRVWYPPVDPGWVPYRNGHWAYVAPWGWTWVDDASWGFAPYHYGRWVQVDDRWGWVPVAPEAPIEVAPVYSPALVDFVGIAAGVAVGAAIGVGVGLALGGGGRGNVGWVPLGFHEPYIPPYGGSPGYIRRINSPNFSRTQNIGTIVNQRRTFINNGTINRGNTTVINNYYSNAAGATLAPQQVMQRGQPVAASARPLTRQQFAQVAQPRLQPQVTPTGQTPGITPAVARQHNIPPAQLIRPAVAPGPVLAARPPGQPPLRPAALQSAGRPTPTAVARPPLGTAPGGVPGPGVPVPGPHPAPQAGRPSPVGAAPVGAAPGGAAPVGAADAGALHPGLPNLAPHGPAVPAVPPGSRPAAVPPQVAGAPGPAARPGAPGPVARSGAPGPAIPPRGQVGGPAAPGLPGAPPLVPHQAAPLTGPRPVPPTAAPTPHVAAPATGRPPAAAAAPAGAAPPAHVPLPPPQVAHPAPPPVARPALPPVARPAPPPVARPAPPPVARPAPPPVARPVQPQFTRPAPPPVMRPPPPVVRPAPPPVMRPPPPMARPAPPPAPPRRVCPAGHPVC